MKVFLFVVFLWTLAISQFMKTDVQQVITKNIETISHQKIDSSNYSLKYSLIYSSEEVQTTESFETSKFVSNIKNTCNNEDLEQQLLQSDATASFEYQLSKSLLDKELLLVDLEPNFTDL